MEHAHDSRSHFMSLIVGLVLITGIAAAGGEQPDWCTTLERWEARGLGGSAVAGGCPIAGSCDIPAVRDNHAPDASTPFKVIRLHFIVFREDDGSAAAATDTDVIEQMERMNSDFAPYKIHFVYTCEYVNNTLFRYNGNDTLMKLTHAVSPATRCNVYVTSLGGGYGYVRVGSERDDRTGRDRHRRQRLRRLHLGHVARDGT